MTFEILIPLRNPTEVFRRSVESVAAQTERGFSVLLSDNHSTQNAEAIREAEARLAQAGIAVRVVQPPQELGRVEHWNWAHFQSGAVWVKPLFAGDWLEADYFAAVRREILAAPECRYVYCGYRFHDVAAGPARETIPAWCGRFRGAGEMREVVLRYAHQFGPPSAAAYTRDAFLALGGYRTTLPVCADSLFFCSLATRFGATGIGRPLANFQLHAARFSTLLPGRLKAVTGEKFTYLAQLAYHAWTENVPLPGHALARLAAREARAWWRERRKVQAA